MPTDLQTDRYDKILRRVGGIVGPGSKVAEVVTDLFPMINVEDVPGELMRLGGTLLSFGGGQITAIAAETPRAQLFNPVASRSLVTVTTVLLTSQATAAARWGLRTVSIGTQIDTQLIRDTRDVLPTQPIAEVQQESNAALANGTGQVRILANTPLTLTDPNGLAVLAPGTGFEIGITDVAGTMHYCFYWRERPALDSELNLP